MATHLQLPRQFSNTGLSFPKRLSYSDWESYGGLLEKCATGGQWWYGDWLNTGEERFGEEHAQALPDSLDAKTLQNYAWVARKIPPERRVDGLSFGHHEAVAKLTPRQQTKFLNKALFEEWTRDRLRREIKESMTVNAISKPTKKDEDDAKNGEVAKLVSPDELIESTESKSNLPKKALIQKLSSNFGNCVRAFQELCGENAKHQKIFDEGREALNTFYRCVEKISK